MASANGWSGEGRGLRAPTAEEQAEKARKDAKGQEIAIEIASSLKKKPEEVNVYLRDDDATIVTRLGAYEDGRYKYSMKDRTLIKMNGYPPAATLNTIKKHMNAHVNQKGGKRRKSRKTRRRARTYKK